MASPAFAFASGGRHRSEVADAVMENLLRIDATTYLYRLTHSKTHQADTERRADADKPLVGRAAEALTAWFAASSVTSGPIFRRLRASKVAEPLSAQAVWRIVKRRAALAGLERDFGAHSLRSGFVTEAGRQGVPLGGYERRGQGCRRASVRNGTSKWTQFALDAILMSDIFRYF